MHPLKSVRKIELPHHAILALDFDGVLCDSASELAHSAWRSLHPESPAPSAALLAAFTQVRPALMTGYESILLIAALDHGVTPNEILAQSQWIASAIRDQAAVRDLAPEVWRAQLKHRFGKVRDKWLKHDFSGWLAIHRFYPHMVDAVRGWIAAGGAIAVITTKERRFALALLETMDLSVPSEAVFGLEAGPKPEVLAQLATTCKNLAFVEDRLDTLREVVADSRLESLDLYLVDWGYNRQSDREAACAHPRIQLLSAPVTLAWNDVDWKKLT